MPQPSPEYTEIWVVHDRLLGRILLKDVIREESRPVLERLAAYGIKTVMLTGDRRETAEAVAKELGLADVCAALSPEEKVDAVSLF